VGTVVPVPRVATYSTAVVASVVLKTRKHVADHTHGSPQYKSNTWHALLGPTIIHTHGPPPGLYNVVPLLGYHKNYQSITKYSTDHIRVPTTTTRGNSHPVATIQGTAAHVAQPHLSTTIRRGRQLPGKSMPTTRRLDGTTVSCSFMIR